MKKSNRSSLEYNPQQPVVDIESECYPETATIILSIDNKWVNRETKRDIAKDLDVLEKEEFHCTLIGSDTWVEILQYIETVEWDKKDKIWNMIVELCHSFDWKIKFQDDFYYIEKSYTTDNAITETRKSIIQIIDLNALSEFYKQLNTLLWTHFDIPYPHITLYTNSTLPERKLRWIGIYSKTQFEELNPKKV